MEPSPAFDSLLRRARHAAGLTQEQLAERSGLSARVISDLERGVIHAPRVDTLELLAEALELDAAEKARWKRLRQRLAQRVPRQATKVVASRLDERAAVPEPLTSLVGRESETVQVLGHLQRRETRLLTLTGPGGIGKTRLALEVALLARAANQWSVAFVDLAPISNPEHVLPAIASTLGIKESASRTFRDELVLALRDRHLLLVLDNVEQVTDSAWTLARLLADCKGLTILATSRAPLRIRGEQLFAVPSLAVPNWDGPVEAGQALLSGAIALFAQRAAEVNLDFRVTDDNAQTVAEICSRLDGLPLAIELAAARVSVLSPAAILKRLDRPLRLLTGGALDLPPRQHTLRETIRWSYALLDPHEQRVFRHLSVFSGGWTLEAAEAVVGAESRSAANLLESVMTLYDKSLLTLLASGDDEPRFDMLETIHEFARIELETTAEAASVRDRHANYFLQIAEGVGKRNSEDVTWIDSLERDHDNMRAAISWLQEIGDTQRGLRLVGALGSFWFTLGFLTEGRAQIRAFLEMPGAGARTADRATALTSSAWLAAWQNDITDALQASDEALSIWRNLGDQQALPETLVIVGIAAYSLGDFERARSSWLECAQVARLPSDSINLAQALNNLATLASDEDRQVEAFDLLQQSLAVSQEYGSTSSTALALGNLGSFEIERGNIAAGTRQIQQALRLYDSLREVWGIAMSLLSLASAARTRGEPVRATRLMAAAVTLQQRRELVVSPEVATDIEHEVASLREVLGSQFQAHWNQGTELTLAEAVVEALKEASQHDTTPPAS